MISPESFLDILATYEKFGWQLRRLLLSPGAKERLSAQVDALGPVEINESQVDAAWFSRPAPPGLISWELRYLGDSPYAILERLDEGDPNFEQQLTAINERLAEAIGRKEQA